MIVHFFQLGQENIGKCCCCQKGARFFGLPDQERMLLRKDEDRIKELFESKNNYVPSTKFVPENIRFLNRNNF